MGKIHILGTALALSASVFAIGAAQAAGSVSATFNTITSANPDVGGTITGVVTGLVKSTLGPDGLPVSTGKEAFQDVNGSGELLWFTPNNNPNPPGEAWVTAGSSNFADGTYSVPFNHPNGFFANGGSDGGANGFISTVLKATFTAPAGGSVTFNLGSDDDAWVFLNGALVVDNGGIHGLAVAPTTISTLINGTNTVDVFQADRHIVESGLYFDANVTLNPTGTPEASTWAMMGLGFAALGFVGYRTRKTSVSIA